VVAIREKVNISQRRACRLAGLSRSVLHYDAKPDHENEVLGARLAELAHERRGFGYRRLHALVGREGTHVNHKDFARSPLALLKGAGHQQTLSSANTNKKKASRFRDALKSSSHSEGRART